MRSSLSLKALLAAACLVLCAPSPAATAAPAAYVVDLDFRAPLHASVDARLTAADGKLFAHSHAGGYEWGDAIKNLHAFREDGSEIALKALGRGQWTLSDAGNGPVHIRYDVDLEFTRTLRESSQRGGQFFGSALYIVNRALFVMSNGGGPIDVRFRVPADFKIATPWTATGKFAYRVADNAALVDNTTILGDFPIFPLQDGPFHMTMALPGSNAAQQALLQPVMQSVLHEYIRIFPKTPEFHILMTVFRGVEINGEGYRDSATLTTAEPIRRDNRVLWANYLAHELFHHWNAALIAGKDDGPTEWFAEGATEYVANRTLVRKKIIDNATYLRMLETNVGMYEFWSWSPAFQGSGASISLEDAASKTALTLPKDEAPKDYNHPGIYNGGWVATYCLDTAIQRASGGTKDLDDLFRLLLDRYGLTGKAYTVDDLARSASEVAGKDLSGFFADYVASPKPLPVLQCLKDGGYDAQILNYAGAAFVTPSHDATALAIRQKLLGRPAK